MLCYQIAYPMIPPSPTNTFFNAPIDETLRVLSELGYDGVEIMTCDPDPAHWDELRHAIEKNQMQIPMICTGELFGQCHLSLTDPDEQIRNETLVQIKRMVDMAAAFGADINIGRVRGVKFDVGSADRLMGWLVDGLKQLCDYALDRNVQIAFETVNGTISQFINKLSDGKMLLDQIGKENLRLMLDIYHMNLEETDLFEAIQQYAADCSYVHLSDDNRKYPGSGTMNFTRILKAFKESGYSGPFTVEILQCPNQKKAAGEAIAALKTLLDQINIG